MARCPSKADTIVFYWVSFIDDYSRFPVVYFVKKSAVVDALNRYRACAEKVTKRKIRVLRDDKGGRKPPPYLADAGISREHSIRDTPQQLRVAERLIQLNSSYA